MTKLRYVILFVSDMERSVAFYRDVLGWPLTWHSPERAEFATEGTTLALHHASKPSGAAANVVAFVKLVHRVAAVCFDQDVIST